MSLSIYPPIRIGKTDFDFSRTYVVGALNVTPDSFSDGGMFFDIKRAIERGIQMAEEGADIIDIGGESTRPGSDPVSVDEEIKRVIPVIKELCRQIKKPISIDTTKVRVAGEALSAGATIVNDISGFKFDPEMPYFLGKMKPIAICMHTKDKPKTMQSNLTYQSLIEEIIDYIKDGIKRATDAGLSFENIIIDPGIGFGKTVEHNLSILRNLKEFHSINRPIMVGTSRKSFIGKLLQIDNPQQRLYGSISSALFAVFNSANFIRVHDVKETYEAVRIFDSIMKK